MKKLSANTKQLLKILNDGEFHSGNELGEALQITRSAVWKMIKGLAALDVGFETHKTLGYKLQQPLILLDSKSIKKYIPLSEQKNCKLELFASLSSTIDYLREKRNQVASHSYWICLAEHQSKGRGRLNRSWYSPFGANVCFSLLYQFNKDISELAGLSLVISLAIVKTLEENGISNDIQVKWPNDVLWRGKKLCGDIIEVSAESHSVSKVIIGIGLNTNMPEKIPDSINQAISSVNQILGQYQDRNKIIGCLIGQVIHYLRLFEKHGLRYFKEEWTQYDFLYGKTIVIINHQQEVRGKMVGINDQGHLLLDVGGKINSYSSGDTTVKK